MQIPSTEAGPPSASWVLVDHTAWEKAASEASQCLHHLGFSSGSLNNSMPTDLGKHVGYGMRDQNTVEKVLLKEWGGKVSGKTLHPASNKAAGESKGIWKEPWI